jgi:hypothetical protein
VKNQTSGADWLCTKIEKIAAATERQHLAGTERASVQTQYPVYFTVRTPLRDVCRQDVGVPTFSLFLCKAARIGFA